VIWLLTPTIRRNQHQNRQTCNGCLDFAEPGSALCPPVLPLRPQSYTIGQTGGSHRDRVLRPVSLVDKHTVASFASDSPPFVSETCPGYHAATTVRISVPASLGGPLVKREFSAQHLKRFAATSRASGGDESMCLQAHVVPGDALSRGHLCRAAIGRGPHHSVALRDAPMTETIDSRATPAASATGVGLPVAPGCKAFGDVSVGGRLAPQAAASMYGYVPRRPRAVRGPAGPGSGDVGLFYEAVERAATTAHGMHTSRHPLQQGSAPEATAADSAASEVMRRRNMHRFDHDLSSETEGLLCSLTAFRYGLQRMESRRRWLGAAGGHPLDVAAPPVSADGVATEPYPSATR
jgi:hypothetical protein